MRKNWFCFFIGLFYFSGVIAQQKPLPDFVISRGAKNGVVISWANNFGDECIQLNVQRSFDSISNFKTIFSTPAPNLPTNGFTDRTPPPGRIFYRIFYMLNGGAYYFTVSKKPEDIASNNDTSSNIATSGMVNPTSSNNSMVGLNTNNNVVIRLKTPDVYNYTMAIYSMQTNKTLFSIKQFPNETLILDKGSFMKKGRFRFEIFYKGQSKEKGFFDIN